MTAVPLLYAPYQSHKAPPEPDFEPDRDVAVVRQDASWTCSCASMAWVMNACGVPSPDGSARWNEWDAVDELRRLCGPGAVSPDYGLAYASGVDLERVYVTYGFVVERRLVSWDDLIDLTLDGVGQLGGARWYHWSAVRDFDEDANTFLLANPAPLWKGVRDDLDPAEWATWGPWNAVFVMGRR